MITDRILTYIAGAACLALTTALFFTYTAKHAAERRADKAELTLSQEREAAATANAQLVQKARETEQNLTAKAAQIEGEKNEQITALARQRDDLRQRLRATATAAVTARSLSGSASLAAVAAPAAGSDRAELSGPAGYDLVSEAYRADTIRLQLATCERQYEAAREALK